MYKIAICDDYPSSNTNALKNVSIKFRKGEKLAVVGKNGSGK